MSLNCSVTSSYGYGGDVTFPPEMDDAMLDDRLEQARLNRTNYYRRMLASRSRPMDDYLVSKKTSYSNTATSGSPVRETSISDTSGTCSVPKIPEPHSSWRFYTSYDNGEWKRHAVPVDHDEEEILREPTKTPRRERDVGSPPVESSLRRMRQAGGPLLACLQPRPKRASESSSDDRKVVNLQSVNGQPVNGIDAQLVGQLGPEELMNLCGNEDLVRRILEGGYVVAFDGENQPQGNTKQEYSSKYMSTVTVTQPTGSLKGPGVAAVEGGPADAAKTETEGSGARKSRRPRIYGFQEKIIIPTKYKTMAEKEGDGVSTPSTSVNQSTSQVGQGEGKDPGTSAPGAQQSDFKVVTSRSEKSNDPERSLRSSSSGKPGIFPESVKVVVASSGSEGEGIQKSEEHEEEGKKENAVSEVAQKETGSGKTFAQSPFVMQEGLSPMENFKAFQENFRKQFEKNVGTEKKEERDEEKNASNPSQRLFSKDEQSFSEVGPDGLKRDGKVFQSYEVITTTDGEAPTVDGKQLSIMEVPITPVGAVRSSSKMAAISLPVEPGKSNGSAETVLEDSPRPNPFGGRGSVEIIREMGDAGADRPRTQKTVEIVRESGNSPLNARRIVETVTENGARDAKMTSLYPKTEERRIVRTSFDDVRAGSLSPRSDEKTSIFDQTGSLFKQLSPRPRAEREKDSLRARDTRQWSRDQGSPAGASATGTWTGGEGLRGGSTGQSENTRRKVVIVRETGSAEDQSRNSGGTTDAAQDTSVGQGSSCTQKKTVEVVRESADSAEFPSNARNAGQIFREMDGAGKQSSDGAGHQSSAQRTVDTVLETSGTSGLPSNVDRRVESVWEMEGSPPEKTSIGGQTLFAPRAQGNPDSVADNEEHVTSTTITRTNHIETSDAPRAKNSAAEPFDSQWEVHVAVKN